VVLGDKPVRECVKTPVVTPPCATQLVVGAGDVPQQVPRAVIDAGTPRDVTLAPKVAEFDVIPETVGEVTVGSASVVKLPSAEYPVPTEFVAYPRK
jgi:hypothetical protein